MSTPLHCDTDLAQRDKAPLPFKHLHASIRTSSFDGYALQHHNITNQNAPTKNHRSPDHSRNDLLCHRTSKATLLVSSSMRQAQQRRDAPLRSFLPAPASITRRVRRRRARESTQVQTIFVDYFFCSELVMNQKSEEKHEAVKEPIDLDASLERSRTDPRKAWMLSRLHCAC